MTTPVTDRQLAIEAARIKYDGPEVEIYDLMYNDVKNWMVLAGQETPPVPTLATLKVRKLRHRLVDEELNELYAAYDDNNLVAVADAIADLLYVVIGTAVAHGLSTARLWKLVHNNNLNKISTGQKDDGGKWIKPIGHIPPDFRSEIVRQWRAGATECTPDSVECPCGYKTAAHPKDAELQNLRVLCNGQRRIVVME